MDKVREILFDPTPRQFNHRVALYGMAGVGKTEVAVEFVHRYRAGYDSIYWIPAVDQASILSGYQNIARERQMPIHGDPVELAHFVLRWLRQQKNWLVVLDNLDDISVFESRLFPENGPGRHTLITTRNPNTEGIPAEGVRVPVLDHVDAVTMLIAYSGIPIWPGTREQEAADLIVMELGYLPLAIQQAGSYIREVTRSFVDYRNKYQSNLNEQYQRMPFGNNRYLVSVSATWSISFNDVRSKNPQASKLLQLLAFLDPNGVSREFLTVGADALDNDLRGIVSNAGKLKQTLNMLEKHSLIRVDAQNEFISIHRLIQIAIRDEMTASQKVDMLSTVINLCDRSFPETVTDENRQRCRDFEGQVLEPLLSITSIGTPKSAALKTRVGNFLRDDGKLRESEAILRQAVQTYQKLSERQPSDTVITLAATAAMQGLAQTYASLGDFDPAIESESRVLETYRRIRGHDDEVTTAKSILAKIYVMRGDLYKAAALEEEVLEWSRRIRGSAHAATIRSMSNLGQIYGQQGRLMEAIKMEKEVLDTRKKVLGVTNPETLTAMNNLALTYQQDKRSADAEKLFKEVVEISKRSVGDAQSDKFNITLMAMGNLALTYRDQGRSEEAVKLEEGVLEINREILGEDHPYTITAMTNLAVTYREQPGRKNDAIPLLENILETQRRVAGEDDPDALKAMLDLAMAYLEVGGREEEARDIQEDVVEKMTKFLGEEHPLTLNAMDNLIMTYNYLGRTEEAVELEQRAIRARQGSDSHREQTVYHYAY